MMQGVKIILLGLLLGGLFSSCAFVKQKDREYLSDPIMQLNDNAAESKSDGLLGWWIRSGRRLRMLRRMVCVLTAIAGFSFSAEGSSLGFQYEYFQDNNEVVAITPGFHFSWEFVRNWYVSMGGEVDGVSGASRVNPPNQFEADGFAGASQQRTPELIDGLSGASTYEFRKSGDLHARYSKDGAIADIGFAGSTENDYRSLSPSLDLAYDLFDRNTTLGFSTAYFWDRFRNKDIYYDGSFGSAPKRVLSLQASLTQSLTKWTLASASIQRVLSTGYLSKPYNPLLVPLETPVTQADGSVRYYDLLEEVLPGRKEAWAFGGEVVQGFPGLLDRLGSLRVKYRYYKDSWELKSHTIDNELSQYLMDDFYIRLRFRYYTQTRAEFIYASYNGAEPFRTADIRYYPFQSYMLGLKFGGRFPDSWTEWSSLIPDTWNIKGDGLLRSTRSRYPAELNPGQPFLYQFAPSGELYNQRSVMIGVDYEL
jgi:hypothetical protein